LGGVGIISHIERSLPYVWQKRVLHTCSLLCAGETEKKDWKEAKKQRMEPAQIDDAGTCIENGMTI
jgi:hypothetical protein